MPQTKFYRIRGMKKIWEEKDRGFGARKQMADYRG